MSLERINLLQKILQYKCLELTIDNSIINDLNNDLIKFNFNLISIIDEINGKNYLLLVNLLPNLLKNNFSQQQLNYFKLLLIEIVRNDYHLSTSAALNIKSTDFTKTQLQLFINTLVESHWLSKFKNYLILGFRSKSELLPLLKLFFNDEDLNFSFVNNNLVTQVKCNALFTSIDLCANIIRIIPSYLYLSLSLSLIHLYSSLLISSSSLHCIITHSSPLLLLIVCLGLQMLAL